MNKIIAIDGPAGSGKGTIAKLLAQKHNLMHIDTGATYRCVALKVVRNNVDLDDTDKIIDISNNIKIELKTNGQVLMDNEDVTKEIRSTQVNRIVSPVSSIPEVRTNMIKIQKQIASEQDAIMDGRDTTTVIVPNAKYKFYLDASIDIRAKRRYEENQEKGIDSTYEEVYLSIKDRDYQDMNKPVGALKRTNDQIYIDTTNLTIEEVVQKIESYLEGEK